MGNYSPVYSQAQTLQVIDQVRYLQRPLLTFTAEDPTFLAAFQASATVTNSKGQTIDTGGLVRELDVNTYLGYFEGAQAPLTEPIRAAVTALFSARGYADANGIRRPAASLLKPPGKNIKRHPEAVILPRNVPVRLRFGYFHLMIFSAAVGL